MFTVIRNFETTESTSSSISSFDKHICCGLECGAAYRVPAGTYKLELLAVGKTPLDGYYGQRYPDVFKGCYAIMGTRKPKLVVHSGDPKIKVPASLCFDKSADLRVGWHSIRVLDHFCIPPDDFVPDPLNDHGDAFELLLKALNNATHVRDCKIKFVDIPAMEDNQ